MSKQIKEMIIDEIRQKLGDHRDVLVVNSSKLDAITNNRFRVTLRCQGNSLFCK